MVRARDQRIAWLCGSAAEPRRRAAAVGAPETRHRNVPRGTRKFRQSSARKTGCPGVAHNTRSGAMKFGIVLLFALSACARAPEAPRARNLLLITVDTLRADRIGAYGYTPARTPRLDALARA